VSLLANTVRISRTVWASCASAASSAVRASASSNATSGWAAATWSVSRTVTSRTMPVICGVTGTTLAAT